MQENITVHLSVLPVDPYLSQRPQMPLCILGGSVLKRAELKILLKDLFYPFCRIEMATIEYIAECNVHI